MRVEPYGEGSILHVTKRGTRGTDIVRDHADCERFPFSLFYLNDTFSDENWRKATANLDPFERPEYWPEREPLVHILAWTLVPNHFHLLIQEIRAGGLSKFMQRVCGSMSSSFNAKYREQGSLFQGSYRAKTVSDDDHLRYLAFYIQVKNVLELYPGGLARALQEFDHAWDWATHYQFSSLSAHLRGTTSPITDSTLLLDLYPDPAAFKRESRALLASHLAHHSQTAA